MVALRVARVIVFVKGVHKGVRNGVRKDVRKGVRKSVRNESFLVKKKKHYENYKNTKCGLCSLYEKSN